MSGDFFEERKGPAVLKHALLSRYVRPYFSKTASRSPHGRGMYIDGYAGPGSYDDEAHGSPVVAVEALEPLRASRNIECVLIEKDAGAYDQLRSLCEQPGWEHATARHGLVEDHIDEALAAAHGLPLLAFLDPFGMGVPLATIDRILTRHRPQPGMPATEILLNVSRPGLYRNAGKLDSRATSPAVRQAHATTVEKLNAQLGDDWWQDIWRSGADDRVDRLVDGYVERIRPPGWGSYALPASKVWEGKPIYHLVLVTRLHDGLWLFNECASSANEEYRKWCHRDELMNQLPEFRESLWEAEIAGNTQRLLAEVDQFVVIERLGELLGEALGFARQTHIRAALRDLYEDDVIANAPKGDLMRFVVRRGTAQRLL